MAVSPALLRKALLALPKVAEAPCYGTPGFRANGKLIARLWQDNRTLVLKMDPNERELLIEADPKTFFVTDHYRPHAWVLIDLRRIKVTELRRRIEIAWRSVATRSMLCEFETAA